MILQVVSLIRPSSRKQHGTKNNKVMVEHLQSGDQTMAPEDSAWQAMPHVCEIGCIIIVNIETKDISLPESQYMVYYLTEGWKRKNSLPDPLSDIRSETFGLLSQNVKSVSLL